MRWYLACVLVGTATGEGNCEHMTVQVNGERQVTDVIDFFQSSLLGFGDPEEDHDERGDVESAIKSPSDKPSGTTSSRQLTRKIRRRQWE